MNKYSFIHSFRCGLRCLWKKQWSMLNILSLTAARRRQHVTQAYSTSINRPQSTSSLQHVIFETFETAVLVWKWPLSGNITGALNRGRKCSRFKLSTVTYCLHRLTGTVPVFDSPCRVWTLIAITGLSGAGIRLMRGGTVCHRCQLRPANENWKLKRIS